MNRPLIVDAHEDLAYNAVFSRMDPMLAAEARRTPPGDTPQRGGIPMVGLPDLVAGNVRVVFSTLFANPASNLHAPPGNAYHTPEEAEAQGRAQLNYYLGLAARDPRIVIIRTRADLERVLAAETARVGFVVLMEGADPILKPEDAAQWFADGVRIVGTSWSATRYAGGTNAPGPLTDLGRALMPEMAKAGLILDISHMAEASFFEAIDLFPGTVIASHSNCRAFVNTDRQLSDEMIKRLAARDAVIGTVLYNRFLQTGWADKGARKADVPLTVAVDHIKHICDLAGDTQHVGIGSDFDGGFGSESAPAELDTVADLYKVGEALSAAGFSDDDVAGYLGGNWLRVLRHALPAS